MVNSVLPGCTYFEQQLTGKFKEQFAVFKAAHMFLPYQIHFIKPDAALIEAQFGGLSFVTQLT